MGSQFARSRRRMCRSEMYYSSRPMKRLAALLLTVAGAFWLSASTALANKDGEGLVYADDELITFTSFAVIGGIVVFMFLATGIQILLERAKAKRKAGVQPPGRRS